MSKLIKNVDLKIKKSIHKIKYLKYELEEVETSLKLYIDDFGEAVRNYAEQNKIKKNIDYNSNDKSDDFNSKLDVEYSAEIKKAYKKIVSITHPDKTSDLSQSEKDKYSDIFLKATKASDEGRALEIIECAEELGLDVGNTGIETLMCLYQEVENLENKIKHHKNTYQWQWGTSGKPQYYLHKYIQNI